MGFEFARPLTAEAAVRLLAETPDAVPMAGGTDLLNDLEEGRVVARCVVSLSALPWRTIDRISDRLRLGSLVPMRQLENDPGIRQELPGLFEALHAVGGVPLRHRATLGGNLGRASPASDLLPILLALEAEVGIVGPSGARGIALDRFLQGSRSVALDRAELIASVSVPASAPSDYVWQRVRAANDISQVGVAVARPVPSEGWRVALGGVAPRPVRLPATERLLRAPRPDPSDLRAAAHVAEREAPFVTDRRATEAYRRRLVEVLVRRALERAIGREATE